MTSLSHSPLLVVSERERGEREWEREREGEGEGEGEKEREREKGRGRERRHSPLLVVSEKTFHFFAICLSFLDQLLYQQTL